ncbi:MAG: hypothetical protein IJ337_08355 [Clostridia bacterium]|nr:hypothetical protein [Clostridia bacterium]
MMTLCARLCTLCAVCALMQMAAPQEWEGGGLRMIGGMLMLHLVMKDAQKLMTRILAQGDLLRIFEILAE